MSRSVSKEDVFTGVFRAAVEATHTGVLITDHQGKDHPIVYCNPAFEQLTHYPETEILGENCRFLQGAETDQKVVSKIREAISEGKGFTGEILNYRKDGTSFWNRLTLSPIRDPSGVITHYVGIQNDVTERVRAEQKREELVSQLRRINMKLGYFAQELSHDLRGPVSSILGTADILSKEHKLDEEGKEWLDRIIRISERALGLIQSVLENSRTLEPATNSRVDINALLVEIVNSIPAELRDRVQLAENFPAVLCVEMQIWQLFQNLITNALKHGEGQVGVRWAKEDGKIRFSVSDEGKALSAEETTFIFQRAARGRSKMDGSGFGLAISKNIVLQHGGKIWVEASPSGTTFHFTLPFRD